MTDAMSDDESSQAPDLNETSKTETTVRQFATDGRVIAETVVTTVIRKESRPDLPTGMYL